MFDPNKMTLVVVGTRAHALTEIAINDMLNRADFKDVLIYTDAPEKIAIPGARYSIVPDWDNKKDAGQFYYAQAMTQVETDYGFLIEWDAGIYDRTKWQDAFLGYDYIGAPWMTTDDHKVGNGGFTIMSKRLGHFLALNRKRFPVYTDWDVCRTQRIALEQAGGFTYAPLGLAHDFSWELINPRSPDTFGYHGIFNWPDMLGHEETARRAVMMTEDPYLLTKMKPLVKVAHQWLPEAIGLPAWQKYAEANGAAARVQRGQTPAHVFRHQQARLEQIRLTRELAARSVNQGQKA